MSSTAGVDSSKSSGWKVDGRGDGDKSRNKAAVEKWEEDSWARRGD